MPVEMSLAVPLVFLVHFFCCSVSRFLFLGGFGDTTLPTPPVSPVQDAVFCPSRLSQSPLSVPRGSAEG